MEVFKSLKTDFHFDWRQLFDEGSCVLWTLGVILLATIEIFAIILQYCQKAFFIIMTKTEILESYHSPFVVFYQHGWKGLA